MLLDFTLFLIFNTNTFVLFYVHCLVRDVNVMSFINVSLESYGALKNSHKNQIVLLFFLELLLLIDLNCFTFEHVALMIAEPF